MAKTEGKNSAFIKLVAFIVRHKSCIALLCYSCLVLAISYHTYVHNFTEPDHLYWDENYHIASAQKYLSHVFFMEPHPPLGKLLLALGEYIFKPNEGLDVSTFLTTDHISSVPDGYSFKGMRFFPVHAAWFCGLFIYLIFYLLSSNPHTAFLFSSLYLFENAMIVHFRGAMLDSIQLFFILLFLLVLLIILRKPPPFRRWQYLILGIICGAALGVKINSGIILLLFPYLTFVEIRARWHHDRFRVVPILLDICSKASVSVIGVLSIFLASWYIHFQVATNVLASRWYEVSPEYRQILASKETHGLKNFSVLLGDAFNFFTRYQRGVPKLDVCKVGENGSYPLTWPVGKKSINYRWERTTGGKTNYLILQSNFPIWFIGLAAIALSCILVGGWLFFGLPLVESLLFERILVFLALYLGYMSSVLQTDRALYLYHYFIPLIFSFILAYLLFHYAFNNYLKRFDKITYLALTLIVSEIIASYYFFSPLTYYQPLSPQEVITRAWFSFWELKPVL